MSLIVGLGNPGSKYSKNRHNAGFMALDFLLNELKPHDVSKKEFKGELYRQGDLYFLKPHTFMNLSGDSVLAVKNYFKIENVIVIHDEIELAVGALRFKFAGGHAGHNGLRSIDAVMSPEYFRVRIGIGKPAHKDEVADYCLSDFRSGELDEMKESFQNAVDGALELAKDTELFKVTSKYTINKK
jgi:peptidyl-tRNA hydrolase, PTH1 family